MHLAPAGYFNAPSAAPHAGLFGQGRATVAARIAELTADDPVREDAPTLVDRDKQASMTEATLLNTLRALSGLVGGQKSGGCQGCGGATTMRSSSETGTQVVASFHPPSEADSRIARSFSGQLVLNISELDLDEAAIAAATSDVAAIHQALKTHPDGALKLVRAIQEGDLLAAYHFIHQLGLSEGQLKAKEGHWIGLVILVCVAIAVLVTSDEPIAQKEAKQKVQQQYDAQRAQTGVDVSEEQRKKLEADGIIGGK